MPHLAPAFAELYHVNINHLQESELSSFGTDYIDRLKPTDIIFILHDEELLKKHFIKTIRKAVVPEG